MARSTIDAPRTRATRGSRAQCASEINFSIDSFWDVAWTVRLGDEMNGIKVERKFEPDEFGRVAAWGLSGILCGRRFSSLVDEPFAEDDGELCLGLEPLARRAFPLLGGLVQDEI